MTQLEAQTWEGLRPSGDSLCLPHLIPSALQMSPPAQSPRVSREATDHGYCQDLTYLDPFPALPSSEVLPDKTERDQYKLLCPDNTWKPVDQYKECHLARIPSRAVVARSEDSKEDFIWAFLQQAQVVPTTVLPSLLGLGWGEVSFLILVVGSRGVHKLGGCFLGLCLGSQKQGNLPQHYT